MEQGKMYPSKRLKSLFCLSLHSLLNPIWNDSIKPANLTAAVVGQARPVSCLAWVHLPLLHAAGAYSYWEPCPPASVLAPSL